jgi:hypothetical protein
MRTIERKKVLQKTLPMGKRHTFRSITSWVRYSS